MTLSAGASGELYLDRRPRPFDRAPMTRLSATDRRRLWDAVVALSGEPDPSRTERQPDSDEGDPVRT